MIICQLTDLHIRPTGVASNRVSETNMLCERALHRVAAMRPAPDVVIIDLTEVGGTREYAVLAKLLQRILTIPVYVIPGNHDRRENLRAGLPVKSADPVYIQYAVEDFPVRLIMLDTVVPGAGHGALRPEQLAWLDDTLAKEPNKPTLIGMHHPSFACGIAHMDKIALRDPERFEAVIARHPQVARIVCGHHHRTIVGKVAHAVATVAPSVAHQVELDLAPDAPAHFTFEPASFHLHVWTPAAGIVTHTVHVEQFPGPFPFLTDPDYPGKS
jgi:3',5'-cyclic-AMP phosphodiesterase